MIRTIVTSLILVAAAGMASADLIEQQVSNLRLRSEAHVRGNTATLADLLDFTQADPRLIAAIGDKPAKPELAGPTNVAVSHDEIVDRLDQLGVNLARVLVDGAWSCQVTLEPRPASNEAEAAVEPSDDASLLRRSDWGSADGNTLRDALAQFVEQEWADAGGSIELEFEQSSQPFLELTSPPFDFTIRGSGSRRLGPREFGVTIHRDGRLHRTVRVAANVKLIKSVLVASKPLNIGATIRRDSLEFATRIFTDARELGIDHPEEVIGQQTKSFVPVGKMVGRDDLKAVDLVKRRQPVTVLGGDSVSLRVVGEALDDGGYGDSIRVRLGNGRNDRRMLRGVVVGVGTVRLAEGTL